MQDFSSTVSYSPSFSYYASGEFATAAVKVSREIQSYNITDHHSVKVDSVNDQDADFEFQISPLHEIDVVFITNNNDDDVAAIPDNFSGTYLWSPLTSPATSEIIKRSKHSSSTPKRCRLKKFLRRSRRDGAISSQSASKRCILKDLIMRMSHRNDGDARKKRSPSASYNVGEGDNRRKSYLPYRQDLIGVFAGIRRLRH